MKERSMMSLEAMIKNMTRETPHGSSYTIGKASITVFYCSDFWEWEYLGETYWDVQDLAEAIAHGTTPTPQRRSPWSKKLKVQERTVTRQRPVMISFLGVRRLLSGVIPTRKTLVSGQIPESALGLESSTAWNSHDVWSACMPNNSIVIACAAPIDKQVSQYKTPTFSLI
jgi:hypothetical protein